MLLCCLADFSLMPLMPLPPLFASMTCAAAAFRCCRFISYQTRANMRARQRRVRCAASWRERASGMARADALSAQAACYAHERCYQR
jgi:hypothetical protein